MDRVFWIGDSTVQDNRIDTWPQCGMGQALPLYLRWGATVCNHAKNGRSAKSFWDEGLFAPVEGALAPGDLLLISFGHNDEKADPARHASPQEYRAWLLRYARLAAQRGALPVLLTPLTRRRFADGALRCTHGPYPQAVRDLAAEQGLPLIDLTAASRREVERLGDEASRALYMNFGPGLYPNYPDGSADDTHLRGEGAVRFAGLVADGLRALGGAYAAVLLRP